MIDRQMTDNEMTEWTYEWLNNLMKGWEADTHRLMYHIIEWLTEWINNRLNNVQDNQMNDWMIERIPNERMIEHTEYCTEWPNERIDDWITELNTEWLNSRPNNWMNAWKTDWIMQWIDG